MFPIPVSGVFSGAPLDSGLIYWKSRSGLIEGRLAVIYSVTFSSRARNDELGGSAWLYFGF